jgi:hypothetical protein
VNGLNAFFLGTCGLSLNQPAPSTLISKSIIDGTSNKLRYHLGIFVYVLSNFFNGIPHLCT